MSIFKEVSISWDGKDYVVAANKVMGLVGSIEEIITIEELASPNVKRVKLARAYVAVLLYAGAKVELEDVFNSLFGASAMQDTLDKINALMSLMIPPEHLAVDDPMPLDDDFPHADTGDGKKKEVALSDSHT